MKPFPPVISYYTLQTPYEEEIKNLTASCDQYQLERSIEGVSSFGSWELNCAYKPFFILKKLEEFKRPLLWVDADGVFVDQPEWIKAFNSDFAVRIHEDLGLKHPSKVISSTIFVSYSPQAIALLRCWAKECQKELLDPRRKLEFWDQIALRDAVFHCPHDAKVASLPLSYAKIFDHPGDCAEVFFPVIEHYQASRRFKQIV